MPATATKPGVEIVKVDPLRILSCAEVCRRLGKGYSRASIMKMLADDKVDNTPGRRFPVPLKSDKRLVQWRELTIINWLLSRETNEV